MRVRERIAWGLAALLAVFVVASLAGSARGGPLDPPGAPAPSFLTLDELQPAWFRVLPANDNPDTCATSRFDCVMGDTAAIDKETGLVWKLVASVVPATWSQAHQNCINADSSGRSGFRLPSIWEIETLEDSLAVNSHQFPAGHPFAMLVAPKRYWSSTTDAGDERNAYVADFDESDGNQQSSLKTGAELYWCVRAP